MSSEKQVLANQLNSQKSTGPKTEIGKSTISKNSTKHGLLSNQTILPWESSSELNDLRASMIEQFKPIGEIEKIIVDRLVSLTWRLRRAGTIETGIYAWKKYAMEFNQVFAEMKSYPPGASRIDSFSIENKELSDENKATFEKLQMEVSIKSKLVNSELPALGRTFANDADIFTTLFRYESGLERSFFKSLHELQRLQASRTGQEVPLPLSVDFHIDSEI